MQVIGRFPRDSFSTFVFLYMSLKILLFGIEIAT